ncbi:hypothetical protein ABW19_dt0207674 [Dactylella cylindrospora]|nr:hypothetical protein ABW19_dt0207674 [Dactylella cylindrospora]
MRLSLFVIVSIWANGGAVAARDCAAKPISFRIGNVTTGSEESGYPEIYGLSMKVGGQQFTPFIKINSPSIHIKSADKSCKDIPAERQPLDCRPVYSRDIMRRSYLLGGFFDGRISPTYNGPRPWDDEQVGLAFSGTDTIVLGDTANETLTLDSWAFNSEYRDWGDELPDDFIEYNEEAWMPSYLGLNKFSFLLTELYNTQRIPSKTWGYFAGWKNWARPDDAVLDGSLVLGGYDRAKISGSFSNFPINMDSDGTERCQFKLTVSGLWLSMSALNDGRGETVEVSTFLNKQNPDGFDICIDPSYPSMQMQSLIRNRVMSQLRTAGDFEKPLQTIPGGSGIGILNSDLPLVGEVSLTFQFGNLNITVPGKHLIHPSVNVTAQGYNLMSDLSDYQVMDIIEPIPDYSQLSFPQDDSFPVLFGHPFLASAYLVVNHENDTFSIAQLAQEIEQAEKKDIIPVLDSECSLASLEEKEGSGLPIPIGAIVGIVVGATVLLIIAIWVYVLLHRRRYQKETLPDPPDAENLEVDGVEVEPIRHETEAERRPSQSDSGSDTQAGETEESNKEDEVQEAEVHEIVEAPVGPIYEMMGDLGQVVELQADVPVEIDAVNEESRRASSESSRTERVEDEGSAPISEASRPVGSHEPVEAQNLEASHNVVSPIQDTL